MASQRAASAAALALIASMLSCAAQAADAAGAAASSPPPQAPAAAASAASPTVFGGPTIPGFCILNVQALFTQSKVGAAATARLQQLQQQVGASVAAQKASLENAGRALAAQRDSLPPAILEQKERSLAQREAAWETTANQRSQQLDATRAKAMERINDEAQSAIAGAYQSHGCGVVINEAAVAAGGVAMDITAPVIQALDAKITTLSFDLEKPAQ